jgi:Protein of unknown function (DUF3040)
VALPMDEQRILEEMERMLAADDPRLAARLAAFGQPSVAAVLRTRRARAALSLLMLAVIAAAAAVIYLVSAFRIGSGGPSVPPRQQTSQRASTRGEQRTVPLPGPLQCQAQITPRVCASWAPAISGGARRPAGRSGVTGRPGAGAGHGAHSVPPAKP